MRTFGYKINGLAFILLCALLLMAFYNLALFSNLLNAYPLTWKNSGFLVSLVLAMYGIYVLLFSLICFGYTLKPIMITLLMLSSLSAYFMDNYNVIIDEAMIRNILNTDPGEIKSLLSIKLVMYVLLLGIVPSYFVYRANVVFSSFFRELINRTIVIVITLCAIAAIAWPLGDYYSSFAREHKTLIFYANPGYYIHVGLRYARASFKSKEAPLRAIGLDARIPVKDIDRELVIFVVGETARADHFSLNGYGKETNPLLKNERVISFTNFWSCGTSTAISVPCMFSIFPAAQFDADKAGGVENALDVLTHAGVNVLWLDNNSSSKGVAVRVPYQDYKSADTNPVCDFECRDEGMLKNLQSYIDQHPRGDILIVLHQKGNHGPAYYERYPSEFRKFVPDCQTNQLQDCTRDEINNAYDNAILYTDSFLTKAIELLKRNDDNFETALLYISDHGESLGENGLFLHGLPVSIAPDSQRHVPAIFWFGKNFDEDDVNINAFAAKRHEHYSHDNIFPTLLGIMEIESSIYDKHMDILHDDQ